MNNSEKKICVFRLSAMGDVIMLVQAVHNLLESNPYVQITLVTRPKFKVFFGEHSRLKFHPIDLNGKHKGMTGLWKLFKELKKQKFDYFLDMHNVLRSRIVRSFFTTSKTKVYVIDKDRKTKKAIVAKKIPLTQQKHSVERYLDVARLAGLKTKENYRFILPVKEVPNISKTTIGIAPFAAHDSKEWGEENVLKLLQQLQTTDYNILLFGGGKREETILSQWENEFSNVTSAAGKHTLQEELDLLSQCNCFIAMDSGNMHIASLMGVPTISIWISTHPFLGFAPWGNEENILQPTTEQAPCRPVSVFGKLETETQQKCVEISRVIITPENVMDKIKGLL